MSPTTKLVISSIPLTVFYLVRLIFNSLINIKIEKCKERKDYKKIFFAEFDKTFLPTIGLLVFVLYFPFNWSDIWSATFTVLKTIAVLLATFNGYYYSPFIYQYHKELLVLSKEEILEKLPAKKAKTSWLQFKKLRSNSSLS
jgi:hypothetical protein